MIPRTPLLALPILTVIFSLHDGVVKFECPIANIDGTHAVLMWDTHYSSSRADPMTVECRGPTMIMNPYPGDLSEGR